MSRDRKRLRSSLACRFVGAMLVALPLLIGCRTAVAERTPGSASVIGVSAAPVQAAAAVSGQEADDRVPAPFEPVRFEPASPASAGPGEAGTVRVWGRAYRFDRGPIPTALESQGRPLLAGAPEFLLEVDGQPRQLTWSAPAVAESGPRSLVLESTGVASGVRITATTTIEYDGMMRVDLTLSPQGEGAGRSAITRFAYRLGVVSDVAEFVSRHVAYDYNALNIDKGQLLASGGRNPRTAEQRFPYTPSFSLGDREVGLEWWSDDNIGWLPQRRSRPLVLRQLPDRVEFEVEPIARGSRVEEDWSHRLALFPFPLRREKPDARSQRFTHWSASRQFSQDGFDYHWIVFPIHFEALYHGLPGSKQNETQRALRRKLADHEIGYIPYGKLTAAPSLHPRTLTNADRWAANHQRFTGAAPEERDFMKKEQGWDGKRWYGYAVCMRDAGYRKFLLEENLRSLREERLGGLYFDAGSVSRMCESDPRVRRRGAQAWHYFETRDFYKRLYEGVERISPEALITVHTNGQPRALTAFMDFNFVGEALNVPFRRGASWKAIGKDPTRYEPDYFALPDGFLEAQLFPPVGGTTSILPEIKFAKDPRDPERLRRYQRAFLAKVLAEDMHFWFGNGDHAELVRVMKAYDTLGAVERERVIPYWQDGEKLVEADGTLRVTTLEEGNRILVVLSNYGDYSRSTGLRLSDAISKGGARRWRDAETAGSRTRPLGPDTRILVRPKDFRLIVIE